MNKNNKIFVFLRGKMRVEIKTENFKSKIKIDGKEINNVTKIEYINAAKEVPIVKIELIPNEIEIDGEAILFNIKKHSVKELLKEIIKRLVKR